MDRRGKAFLSILLFLLVSMYPTVLTTLGITVPVINPEKVTLVSAVFQLTVEIVVTLIIVFLYRDELDDIFYRFGQEKGRMIKRILGFWLIAFLAYFITNSIIIGIFNIDMPNNILQKRLLDAAPIYLVLSMLFATPIMEEFVFRKAFHDLIDNKWMYILMSSILYGSFYVILSYTNSLQLLFIISHALFAGVLAYAYDKTDNLIVPVGIHILQNILFLILNIL